MSGLLMVGSWNALPAFARAAAGLKQGEDLLDALAAGVGVVEDDPEEMSVGYGGLPNEDGEVELDAAIMDGPSHRAGAVAGLRGIKHAAGVALQVMRRTDHALLVGQGAMAFARKLGFPEQDLLTPRAREAWLAWRATLSPRDAWIGPDEGASQWGMSRWAGATGNPTPGRPPEPSAVPADVPAPGASGGAPRVPFTFGTIHVSARVTGAEGAVPRLAACTSTSGLSYKIAGRAGDSPIVGAGIFVDNAVGSAGATGRGEAVLLNCGAFHAVHLMSTGMTPGEACLAVLRAIAARTRDARLRDVHGRPTFNVTMYALRADGLAGGASMHEGYQYTILDERGPRLEPAPFVFGRA